MHRNLEFLLEIQALEVKLREVDADIAALPKHLAVVENQLQDAQQAVDRAKAAEAGSQSERRQVDREIEALRAKIDKIRAHSGDVKTNQEYKALLDEIAFAESQIAKHEEHLLEIMEGADALARQLKEAEAALATQRAQVASEAEALKQNTKQKRADREQLAAQRQQLRTQVDELWLRRFDRVLRMRSHPLAAIEREACSGCHVRQRPQFLQEMDSDPERLFICESCGRILYLETDKVASGQS